jgi:hypothetical protein
VNIYSREAPTAIVRAMPEPETPAILVSADDKTIPRGPKTVINRMVGNGWDVQVSYCRGPWPKQVEKIAILTIDDDGNEIVTGEERIKYGQADSYLIRARRAGQKIAVFYIFRDWLASGKFDRLWGYARGPTTAKVTDHEVTALVTRESEES